MAEFFAGRKALSLLSPRLEFGEFRHLCGITRFEGEQASSESCLYGFIQPPGYLVFLRAGTLLAQPFDPDRLELKGEAIPMAEDVHFDPPTGGGAVAASENGVLAYRSVS
jgi:hypothetical protein